MKKYLVKGALALFGGAFLFSCAEKESEYVPLAQQKVQAFEDVFKEIYGDIDPYQDWGFSSGKVEVDPNDPSQVVEVIDLDGDVAVTRSVAFGGIGGMNTLLAFNSANTRSASTNANQWAQSYNVPDPLTPGQKARVQFYFQNVQYPGGTEDKGTINFFMQQVYDGGDDPLTKYDGYSAYSKEVYPAADGSTLITSGEHMDHLTAGSDNEHVNNFNNGTCSTNHNVGDNGAPLDTDQHSDEIMLMLSTKTDCFGYANSDASFVRNDRYRLVAGSVIDQWINENSTAYNTWLSKHSGITDDIVDDKWHRSFIGFDFDMLPDDKLYAKVNGNYEYLSLNLHGKTKVWNGSQLVDANTVGEVSTDQWGNTVFYPYIPGTKTKIRSLVEQSNQYCGTPETITDTQLEHEINNDGKYASLEKVYDLLNHFALPKYNSAGKTWIKVGNCADGYYSDWIVSFLPAGGPAQPSYFYPEESIDEWTQIESGRVFCEDLGRATREDLDYNDVVFDAIIFQNHTKYTKWRQKWVNGVKVGDDEIVEGPTEATRYYANVEILAAGGTIPITVKDYQVHDQFNPKAAIVTMINTRDNNSTAYGSYDEREPVQIGTISKNFRATLADRSTKDYNLKLFEIEKPSDNKFIKTIKIVSSFDNAQVSELNGEKGGAPQKFMAPIGTKWTSERKNISLAYPDFDAWVKGGTAPWSNVNPVYVYDQTHNSNSIQLPLVMKARRTISIEGELELWTGPESYGGNWSLANATLNVAQFYPGDRLRFYGEEIGDEAWITVVVGDITPYFIDSDFPNYVIDADGNKEARTTGCIEVMLDENSAALLNSKISDGKVTFQVQGRKFVLTRICRVLFE